MQYNYIKLHNRRVSVMFHTLAGGLRKGGVVTQVVGQIKAGHAIHLVISGEHQVQRVTVAEESLHVRRDSGFSTGAAISQYC